VLVLASAIFGIDIGSENQRELKMELIELDLEF